MDPSKKNDDNKKDDAKKVAAKIDATKETVESPALDTNDLNKSPGRGRHIGVGIINRPIPARASDQGGPSTAKPLDMIMDMETLDTSDGEDGRKNSAEIDIELGPTDPNVKVSSGKKKMTPKKDKDSSDPEKMKGDEKPVGEPNTDKGPGKRLFPAKQPDESGSLQLADSDPKPLTFDEASTTGIKDPLDPMRKKKKFSSAEADLKGFSNVTFKQSKRRIQFEKDTKKANEPEQNSHQQKATAAKLDAVPGSSKAETMENSECVEGEVNLNNPESEADSNYSICTLSPDNSADSDDSECEVAGPGCIICEHFANMKANKKNPDGSDKDKN